VTRSDHAFAGSLPLIIRESSCFVLTVTVCAKYHQQILYFVVWIVRLQWLMALNKFVVVVVAVVVVVFSLANPRKFLPSFFFFRFSRIHSFHTHCLTINDSLDVIVQLHYSSSRVDVSIQLLSCHANKPVD